MLDLAGMFNEDGNLDRSFSSWAQMANEGFSSAYQYIVNFWNSGVNHLHAEGNQIAQIAEVSGEACSQAVESFEPFLDQVLGAVSGALVSSNISQLVDDGVTGIVDLLSDDFSQFLNQPTNTTYKKNMFELNIGNLDAALREDNNVLERSATNLSFAIDNEKVFLSLQSVFLNNENLTASVVVNDDSIQITIVSTLAEYNSNVVVSYSVIKPSTLCLNESDININIDQSGKIYIYIPILSRGSDKSSFEESTEVVSYCGVSILSKEI